MNTYLIIILAILIGTYLLDTLIDILDVRHFKTELPDEFIGHYDEERYRTSQEYLKENTRFGIINDTVNTLIIILFILFGGFNIIDQFARGFNLGSIPTGLIFTATLMLLFQIIHIPFSIYQTFIIEEKYGFNKTTPKTFILDILKSWLLIAIIGGIILSGILWFFEKTGEWAWIYCWIAVTIFQLLLLFIAPVLIMPLFNKFLPLEDGPLKKAIEDYAGSQDFTMKGVFTMDGSKRSTKSNAFFTSFGKFRRIVLFDTLIEKHTVDELVSILAHEMGHYKKRHVLKTVIISIITTGLMFFILSLFINNSELFAAFKMQNTSIYASLFFFGLLYSPIEMILSVFGNMLSRRHEYDADAFSAATYMKPESMISGLKKLSIENLINLTPHPLKVFLTYSHPPVLERIRAIRNIHIKNGSARYISNNK
ncbi:MAG TPA: M48 family metallopeptidase [Desulfobacteraceae bacterium]|nr:M48 family metallopeptidase [Desulfobacteraceae bacterium]HPJ68549.1 M48 family metallopeptidase [Desulfobacteraceae bacterium]HPQ28693.1 M48 family metallopeptidase [Desulfobacteraceae bacterium]